MKSYRVLLVAALFIAGQALGSSRPAIAQELPDSGGASPASGSAQTADTSGSDSNPTGPAEVVIPAAYRVSVDAAPADANDVLVTPVYFTPQDENTSATVIFLYNTTTTDATVGLTTYSLTGSVYINTSILVPAGDLVRICSDSVSSISGTWQSVALVNFTTYSTYAMMSVPTGVRAEAYVVWNNGDTYDPLSLAHTLPIRFSTDPSTVFVPLVLR